MKQTIFVLSSDHSGSTWVGYVLGSHSASAFLGEYGRAWGTGLAVPCTLCATRGLPECAVLHGIADVPAAEAYDFAFARFGKTVLVDNTKVCDWTARFIAQPQRDYAIRLVHVVKDPRNWLASRRRRAFEPTARLLRLWCETNASIHAFAQQCGCAATTVFYDELTQDQSAGFAALFDFCCLPFERDALFYWRAEHHGFAANGASSSIFADRRLGEPPAHFATADQTFYMQNDKTLFADRRWRHDLSAADRDAVAADPGVADLLARFGRRLVPEGLAPLAPPPRSMLQRLRRRFAAGA